MIDALAKEHGVDLSVPYEEAPKKFQQELLLRYGKPSPEIHLYQQKHRRGISQRPSF